ncbi:MULTISPECIES: DUF2252 domain-containing protein [unclassified Streptomyces]|uniref:DUF2252 domain-containing protein n=1 Tax=unclassified Streptomyces TaxID=2593676 RepID=UPI0035E0599E
MTSPAERLRRGRAVRKITGRAAHGRWTASPDRPDPVGVLQRQATDRVPELLPIRYGRMAASPLAFLRGAASVMAADLATTPQTGLTVQLCGDAHLLNFGMFASPERALLFDLNDFDETFPGPFEWDVKRLASSVAVAARDNGHGDDRAARAALGVARAYRETIRELAGHRELDVWYHRTDTADLLPLIRKREVRDRVEANLARARRRTSLRALGKLTEVRDGRRRIIHDPPLLEPLARADSREVDEIFDKYRSTLPEERRLLLDRFRFADVARKVVGVGSVGTRCFIVLLLGRDADDPLFLQIKEAVPSVLQGHLPDDEHEHQGHRVVAGQRRMQAAGDIFLGWTTGPAGRHFYGRQLRDMKGSADLAGMPPGLLARYAELCARALARAHARTGDRIAIAGYLGGADTFDRAVAGFALRYADRTRADHALLTAAVADGRITATSGV